MKLKILSLMGIFLCMLCIQNAFAQSTATGKVTASDDNAGLPVLLFPVNIVANEIVAHWNFNTTVNKIIPDVIGSHPAIISDNSEANIFVSPVDKAVFFNGGSTSVETKHTEDLSLEDDFTIKCIIKPTNFNDFRTILFKGDRKSVPNLVNYYLTTRNGIVSFMTKLPDNNWANWSSTEAVLTLNDWHLLVLSYKNGIVKLWVNGKSCTVNQATPPLGGKLIKNNFPLYIGHAQNDHGLTSFPFIGLIDDIKIIKGAVITMSQFEIDNWNNLLINFVQREKNEKVNTINTKIELYSSRFSVAADDIQSIRTKLATVAALPANEFEAGLAALEIELNTLFFKSYFKRYCSNPNGFVIAPLETSKRVDKRPDFITLLPPGSDSIKLQISGNEYEGFQVLMIANPNKDVSSVQIKISDLVHISGLNSIKSDQINIGRIQDIVTSPPDYPVDFSGAIPDMIEDGVLPQTIPKASFVPVYFRVYVPDKTPAGIYNGLITFNGNGMKSEIQFQLRVFDFSLPKRFLLKMAFSFFENYYEDWYNMKPVPETQKMYIYNFLLKYGISPNNIYHTAGTYPEQKYLEIFKERINFFTFSGGGPAYPVSESALQTLVANKEAVYNQIKSIGLEKYAYYYSYDEISKVNIPGATQMLSAMRAEIPGLKAMQTSFPTSDIKDLFNVWSPLFSHFGDTAQLQVLAERKNLGDEIWWYATGSPSKPYPNFLLDYPVFDSRIISALSYMYDIEGVLLWSINREWSTNMDIKDSWPQKPWKPYIIDVNTQKRVFKNGMGNLIYPGPSGKIYPSLRLENLRDGVEDYEYLATLKNSIEQLKLSDYSDKQILLDNANELLQVPSNVALKVNYYSPDPDNLLKYRKDIGEMIEKINKVTFTGINKRF